MEKNEALNSAMSQIERQFGKGAIMRMGDAPLAEMEAIPTGALSLDLALGIGGLPRGRIVEIYGPESSGKTTMVYHLIAEAQKRGGLAAFIDAEHAMDPVYARNIGVNVDELLLSQPDHGEQARSPTCWCGRRRSTWSPSTPWPPWCRRRRSKGRWATPTSACRRG
jgi:recombination protein RecA